ncbi:MAG TPA: class I SAM-dependent methyltransferase [Anaeromyxobacter sp.]
MTDVAYDTQFYADISDGSRRSAAAVAPLVLRVLPGVRSVVDFGCGSGTWLAEFSVCGVSRVTGLDFGEGTSEYMFIPRDRFRVADLSRPVRDVPRHDLAMSIEVAEHLPESSARGFVESITSASDLVMFSAAIPLQGGHNHVNERWPGYWIALFRECGYRCHDVLRPMIWDDKRVEWWYRQNLLLFVREGIAMPALEGLPTFGGRDLVHPERLIRWASPAPAAAAERADVEAQGAPDHAAIARRLGPRSTPLRLASKALQNAERTARRVGYLLRGRSKDEFKRDWRTRLDARLVRRSGLFDAAWYARAYADAAASGMDPFDHFVKVGLRERRDPGPRFSSERWLARHPWLLAYDEAPVVHFLHELRARRAGRR